MFHCFKRAISSSPRIPVSLVVSGLGPNSLSEINKAASNLVKFSKVKKMTPLFLSNSTGEFLFGITLDSQYPEEAKSLAKSINSIPGLHVTFTENSTEGKTVSERLARSFVSCAIDDNRFQPIVPIGNKNKYVSIKPNTKFLMTMAIPIDFSSPVFGLEEKAQKSANGLIDLMLENDDYTFLHIDCNSFNGITTNDDDNCLHAGYRAFMEEFGNRRHELNSKIIGIGTNNV